MNVIHQVPKVATRRSYGSFVAPPSMLTLGIVNSTRCQIRNSRIVSPPQRIQREENDDARFFLITYLLVRAPRARRHSAAAEYTCTPSATTSATRISHRKPACGRNGSPMVRRCSAYWL